MSLKKVLFIAFAAIILLIPIYVAVSSQNVLDNGKLYKFKPMAFDPFDPFRGKYLRVNYQTNDIPTEFNFEDGETVYVSIGQDQDGFAFFEEAFKSPPKNVDYLKSTVESSFVNEFLQREIEMALERGDNDMETIDTRNKVTIKIPDNMNKYFINENAALRAEKVFRRKRDNCYIGVRIMDGTAILEDIYVFDQPILEYLNSKK